ncbi:lysozyme inhibitor LprI family protein [Sandaracinobacteroides hominis]|uniref:lysozyme inhibitor LprI family protein n=1 Tax=Sandaracinobacteroides hominis TaxID=2780086 RepID=UPI0018F3A3BB|nr:lysozyme inhibitor LprI family protein [Sandaracinobacteroides hominis]
MIVLLAMLLMTESEPPSLGQLTAEDRAVVQAGEEASAWLAATYPDCENPKADDFRPYTLCLAETDFDRAEADMQRVWALTLARVRAAKGLSGERKVKSEQRKWLIQRDRQCGAAAAETPVTQFSRNDLSCKARLNADRIMYPDVIAR